MKELTMDEFVDRMNTIARARKIFIKSGITKNITDAFTLYQEVLADHHRDVFLHTYVEGSHPKTFVDQNYIRPQCPECRSQRRGKQPLYLRIINMPKGPQNMYGYKSAWICMHPKCIYEEFSYKTLDDWMNTLPRKNPNIKVEKKRRKG